MLLSILVIIVARSISSMRDDFSLWVVTLGKPHEVYTRFFGQGVV